MQRDLSWPFRRMQGRRTTLCVAYRRPVCSSTPHEAVNSMRPARTRARLANGRWKAGGYIKEGRWRRRKREGRGGAEGERKNGRSGARWRCKPGRDDRSESGLVRVSWASLMEIRNPIPFPPGQQNYDPAFARREDEDAHALAVDPGVFRAYIRVGLLLPSSHVYNGSRHCAGWIVLKIQSLNEEHLPRRYPLFARAALEVVHAHWRRTRRKGTRSFPESLDLFPPLLKQVPSFHDKCSNFMHHLIIGLYPCSLNLLLSTWMYVGYIHVSFEECLICER